MTTKRTNRGNQKKWLSSKKNLKILDLGCSNNNFWKEANHFADIHDFKSDFKRLNLNFTQIKPDERLPFNDKEFDYVICSHVLEHQLNVNSFLKKLYSLIENDGFLAITVPPARSTIVGGHLTNWNAGLLLYNLVLAGFDCSNAKILAYGYNISIIVQKKRKVSVIPSLGYDVGDIRLIKPFLPQLKYFSSELDDPFFGYILIHDW